jgi:four helix bundle protein
MAKFRFEDLEIWKLAIEIGMELIDISEVHEDRKLFRFADQTRGVAMSISNNIAESTGTDQIGEQRQLLRYARRECFEAVNILIISNKRNIITEEILNNMKDRLHVLSRKIYNYSSSLAKA